ncbi:unconventional myosin-XVI-like isoform X1 [Petromyzon marinus]|uniref:unconventional myosin-XVI-like isoform X1 n=2 Tax=Petromyzon marinus TaxID=7757 RepID=UPI003F6E9A48
MDARWLERAASLCGLCPSTAGCLQLCQALNACDMEIDQRLLDSLPPSQRQRIVKRLRSEQLRAYNQRERDQPQPQPQPPPPPPQQQSHQEVPALSTRVRAATTAPNAAALTSTAALRRHSAQDDAGGGGAVRGAAGGPGAMAAASAAAAATSRGRRHAERWRCRVRFSAGVIARDAIERMDDKEVFALLDQGLDPNETSPVGDSFLHQAARHGNEVAALALLGRGARVEERDGDAWTPLHAAGAGDQPHLVGLLLHAGADLLATDCDGRLACDHTPRGSESDAIVRAWQSHSGLAELALEEARGRRDAATLAGARLLVSEGARSVDQQDERGVTALHTACVFGCVPAVRLLLEAGADPDRPDSTAWGPLHLAAKYGQARVVRLLLRHGADPTALNCNQNQPSEVASSDFVREMLVQGQEEWRERGGRPRGAAVGGTGVGEEEQEGGEQEGAYEEILHDDFVPAKRRDPWGPSPSRRDAWRERRAMFGEGPGRSEPATVVTAATAPEEAGEGGEAATCNGNFTLRQVRLTPPSPSDDVATLEELTERSLLYELEKRFQRQQLYTYIGDILLVLNPFREMSIYSKMVSQLYLSHSGKLWATLPPHVFAVAERAYHALRRERRSQGFMLSGESGSGKSESCRLLIQHLLHRSQAPASGLADKISHAHTILEALGNARTVLNPSASAFTKHVELQYSHVTGCLLGASVRVYLLETWRLGWARGSGWSLAAFRLLLEGLPAEQRARYCLLSPTAHRFLSQNVGGQQGEGGEGAAVVGGTAEARHRFLAFQEALAAFGFTDAETECVLALLAAVLHLGDVPITLSPYEDGTIWAHVPSTWQLQMVGGLLQVEPQELGAALATSSRIVRGEMVCRRVLVSEAERVRDLLAQSLYSRLFSYIVHLVDTQTRAQHTGELVRGIAVLDYPGLHTSGGGGTTTNTFEQLCSTLLVERLQYHAHRATFALEWSQCQEEGIAMETTPPPPPSNCHVLQFFFQAPGGFLSLLDAESEAAGQSDEAESGLPHKLRLLLQATPLRNAIAAATHDGNGNTPPAGDCGISFVVRHFAGKVTYDLSGVVTRNRLELPHQVTSLLKVSPSVLVSRLFRARLSLTGTLADCALSRHAPGRSHSAPPMLPPGGAAALDPAGVAGLPSERDEDELGEAASEQVYSGSVHSTPTRCTQLTSSVREILGLLRPCSLHVVLCVRPIAAAPQAPPTAAPPPGPLFQPDVVARQLRTLGVVAMARARRHGYAARVPIPEFLQRYAELTALVWSARRPGQRDADACRAVLQAAKLQGWQVGVSRVLLKYWQGDHLAALCLQLRRKIVICQQAVRRFVRWRRRCRTMSVHRQEAVVTREFVTGVEDACLRVYDSLVIQNASDIARESDRLRSETHRAYLRDKLQRWRREEETRQRASSPLSPAREPVPPWGPLPDDAGTVVARQPLPRQRAELDGGDGEAGTVVARQPCPWQHGDEEEEAMMMMMMQGCQREEREATPTPASPLPRRRAEERGGSPLPRRRAEEGGGSPSPRRQAPPPKPKRDPGTRLSQSTEAVSGGSAPEEPARSPAENGAGSGKPRPHSDEFCSVKKQPPPKPKRHPETRLSSSHEDMRRRAGSAGAEMERARSTSSAAAAVPARDSQLLLHQQHRQQQQSHKHPHHHQQQNHRQLAAAVASYPSVTALRDQKSSRSSPPIPCSTSGRRFVEPEQVARHSDSAGDGEEDEEPVYAEMLCVAAPTDGDGKGGAIALVDGACDDDDNDDEEGDGIYEEMRFVAPDDGPTPALAPAEASAIPAPFPDLPPYRPPLLVFPPAPTRCSPNSDESPLTPIEVTRLLQLESTGKGRAEQQQRGREHRTKHHHHHNHHQKHHNNHRQQQQQSQAAVANAAGENAPPQLYRTQSAHGKIGHMDGRGGGGSGFGGGAPAAQHPPGAQQPPAKGAGFAATAGQAALAWHGYPTMPRLRSAERGGEVPGSPGRQLVRPGSPAAHADPRGGVRRLGKSSSLPVMEPPMRPPPQQPRPGPTESRSPSPAPVGPGGWRLGSPS